MSKKRAVYEGCTNLKEIGQRDLENLSLAKDMMASKDFKDAAILVIPLVFLFAILMSGVDPSALVMK
jgi:hypothetical protein